MPAHAAPHLYLDFPLGSVKCCAHRNGGADCWMPAIACGKKKFVLSPRRKAGGTASNQGASGRLGSKCPRIRRLRQTRAPQARICPRRPNLGRPARDGACHLCQRRIRWRRRLTGMRQFMPRRRAATRARRGIPALARRSGRIMVEQRDRRAQGERWQAEER